MMVGLDTWFTKAAMVYIIRRLMVKESLQTLPQLYEEYDVNDLNWLHLLPNSDKALLG